MLYVYQVKYHDAGYNWLQMLRLNVSLIDILIRYIYRPPDIMPVRLCLRLTLIASS